MRSYIVPFGFSRLPSLMDELFDTNSLITGQKKLDLANRFSSDIRETDTSYIVEAELPGFDKDDIKIEVEDNVLKISAETKKESEEKKDNYVRKERYNGKFVRSFRFEGIDEDAIKAKYDKGILSVELPKTQKSPLKKGIEIE